MQMQNARAPHRTLPNRGYGGRQVCGLVCVYEYECFHSGCRHAVTERERTIGSGRGWLAVPERRQTSQVDRNIVILLVAGSGASASRAAVLRLCIICGGAR